MQQILGKKKTICDGLSSFCSTQFSLSKVLIVYNIINPGRNTDRGKALRQKAETKKMLLKKMKMADEISDEEFTTQVSKCVATLSESQECMALLVRKIWNTHSVWKSQKKVSFNIASYGQFWLILENLKFEVKQCYQTGHFFTGQKLVKKAKIWRLLGKLKLDVKYCYQTGHI